MKGKVALALVALIATFTAFSHLSCIYLGPSCYQAQMAPPEIVSSAIEGTWFAPISTVVVSALFLICAGYALSAAGFLRKLPLLGTGVYCISALCILRGLATAPLSIAFPEMVSAFSVISGLIWLGAGLMMLLGYRSVRKADCNSVQLS